MLQERKSQDEQGRPYVGGVTIGETIYLPPSTPINRFGGYFHEAGHIISSELSFKKGEVLQPYEAKDASIKIPLLTKMRLVRKSMSKGKSYLDSEELSIAQKILEVFTKGNFDTNRIKIKNVDEHFINSMLYLSHPETHAYTIRINSNGEFELDAKSSKRARNIELGSYAVGHGCTVILLNSLSSPFWQAGMIKGGTAGSHERALKIVHRAYEKQGWIIPSDADLGVDDPADE